VAETDLTTLRRLAIGGVVLAIPLQVLTVVLSLAAVGDLEAVVFGDVERSLNAGAGAAPLWRWAMLTDMFDSYLLLLPLALYGHRLLRDRRPWLADIGLAGALAYIFLGAASAASLAIAGSNMIESYAAASPDQQLAISSSFTLMRDIFYFAIWQMLDAITVGTWVFTSGLLLLAERRRFGRLLVVAGLGAWAGALLTMIGVHSLPMWALLGVSVVAVWAAWISFDRGR
jgi:hypothetical protein